MEERPLQQIMIKYMNVVKSFISNHCVHRHWHGMMIVLLLTSSTITFSQNINRQMVRNLLSLLAYSKPDTGRIRILHELGKFHVLKPGEVKADLDSGRLYLGLARDLSVKLHDDRWRHETEGMLIIAGMEAGDMVSGRTEFAKLIRDCQLTDDRYSEAMARMRLAIWIRTRDQGYPEVLDQFNQSIAIFRSLGNIDREIEVWREIAQTYLDAGDLPLAEKELNRIMVRCRQVHYSRMHYIYNVFANLRRLKGDFNEGLNYSLLCIESMQQTGDTLAAAAFYGDLAKMYMEVGNKSRSLHWHKRALDKWRSEGLANFALFKAAGFIALDLVANGKAREALSMILELVTALPTTTIIQKACVAQTLAHCYDALDNTALAEKYYLQAHQLYQDEHMDFEDSQEAQLDIGKFYVRRKDYKKAGAFLRQALAEYPQKNAVSSIIQIHYMLYKVDSAEGNYYSAMDHFRQNKYLTDSIFTSTKSRQIEELQIKYETKEKEKNIELLSNQATLQATRLEQANLFRNVTIAGILLLLTIVALLFSRFRIKQKNNENLQLKQAEISSKNKSLEKLVQEKEWLLKEVHHRVKNNLHTVMSLLETQSVYLKNEARDAVEDTKHRVFAMSLIHQKLYQTGNLTSVNLAVYIPELISYLKDSFDLRNQIRFETNIAEVILNIAQAVPLGLILNEAITNSIKYAFPDGRPGLVTILLDDLTGDRYQLVVRDNGVGLRDEPLSSTSGSMGMRLMKGLSEDINAGFILENRNGVAITIDFSVQPELAQDPLPVNT